MAVGLATGGMIAALRGGENPASGLNRAGAQQDMPVHPPGFAGERGRHTDEIRTGPGKMGVERRKPEIVADCQPGAAPWQIGNDRCVARPVGC